MADHPRAPIALLTSQVHRLHKNINTRLQPTSDADITSVELEAIGDELHAMATRLFPICRSVTGDGVRETLQIMQESIPLDIVEVPTGTEVFDWVVPHEWNIRDAYVKNSAGKRVIDFRQSNLHLVNGSQPVQQSLTWGELKKKIHSIQSQPERIPFITCFHKDDWGFCISQTRYEELEALGEQTYEVVIDSVIKEGSLTYGEYYLPGESSEEILFSAHICHPSLANDNLSGICIAILLANRLMQLPRRRYSYRFLFAPATIGAITWLAQNHNKLDQIKHGLVLSLLGDSGHSTYKRSRSGDAEIDQIVEHVLKTSGEPFSIRNFTPYGYDERQFCSPGINLSMGCLMRTPDSEFAEYHTSGDNLEFIEPAFLADSFNKCHRIIEIIENDYSFINLRPMGEPRLGKHGLYESLPADTDQKQFQQAVQWVLNLSDGDHSLFDIAVRSQMDFSVLLKSTCALVNCGLIAQQ